MATFYLSSTYEDLKEYREQVSDELRNMGHHVVGMENYTAAGAAPLTRCLADVAKCDAYIGIFAWRYGYVPKGNNPQRKSITELEYDQAFDKKKGILIFILDENAPWYRKFTDDGEKKECIESLRQSLATKHQVGFFKNSDDLTKRVMAAVARFVDEKGKTAGEETQTDGGGQGSEDVNVGVPRSLDVTMEAGDISEVVSPTADETPLPTPAKPRLWKWFGLAASSLVVLGLVLAWIIRGSGGDPLPNKPDEYPTEKKYDFLISEKDALGEMWNLNPGKWDLKKSEGEGEDQNDGALLIKGNQMATPKDLGPKVFYDYQADFKVRFESGDKAAWVLRAQPDAQSGYLFELRKAKGTVFINGWILKNNRTLGPPLPGGKTLRYSTCCQPTDALSVVASIIDTPADGTHIKCHFAMESDFGHSTEDTFKTDEAEIIDSEYTFKSGSVGLLVTDGITERNSTNSVMRVEYVYLTPLRRNGARTGSSAERSSP